MPNVFISDNSESEAIGQECPFSEEIQTTNTSIIKEPKIQDLSENILVNVSSKFNWNAKEQGIVLGAFYYGFILSVIPGGYLVERFGSKWIMLASIWGGVFCTFISPVVAKYGGVNAFIALKSFQGLLQGPIFPGTMNIISSWIPPSERSSSVTIIWAGRYLESVRKKPDD